ncbi:MAG: hypothetical protein EBU43_08605, partial [Actinobacteria bacterium]|nr:hypothetical protein [Actinomycetota bacterium]
MRKALFASLIMAIWGSLVLSPASATGKAGTTCTRLNQKIESGALSYTCIKSGKKLVWSKGIPVKKGSVAATEKPRATPAPTTAPTSAPIPTPNPASAPNLEQDGFPSNIPAPGRSCPNVGGLATLYGAKLTCLKNESSTDGGKWVLNPGEVLVNPNVTPGATSPTSPSGATSNQAAAPSAIPLTISGTSSTSAVATANRDLNRPSIQSALTAIKDIQDTL